MPIAWQPYRSWNFCVSEDEKKKKNQSLLSNAFNVYNVRVFCEYLVTWYSSEIFVNCSNLFLFRFWYKCSKIYTWKYLKQYVTISHVLLISLNQNV